MPGIAHKNLTDPQLHEPKGASAADKDTVCVSKGDGTTEWTLLNIEQLNFNPILVNPLVAPTLLPIEAIDPSPMSASITRNIADALNFSAVNKNTKELAVSLAEAIYHINQLQEQNTALLNQINTISAALRDLKIFIGGV